MKLTYRPEIDGLRAVAVICVILYHSKHSFFGKDWFSGGFVGVDVFFVISGYLISSIIFKELFKTGTFSFSNFYKRRIRRIIPALSFVMLLSIPFAWSYILPSSLVDFAKAVSTPSQDESIAEARKTFWSLVEGSHEDQIYLHIGYVNPDKGIFDLAGKDK